MTSIGGLAAELGRPPDTEWFANGGQFRSSSPVHLPDRMWQVIEVERFWEDRPAELRRAAARWLAGAGSIGPVFIVVEASERGIRYLIGGDLVCETLTSAMAGVDLKPGRTPTSMQAGRAELAGVPGRPARGLSSLVDALVRGRWAPWRLIIQAQPTSSTILDREIAFLSALSSEVADATRSTRHEAALVQRESVDVAAERYGDRLRRLLQRHETMRASISLATTVTIEAPSEAAARALAVMGAAVFDPVDIRPMRGFASGGNEPAVTLMSPDEVAAVVAPPSIDLPGFRVKPRVLFDGFIELSDDRGVGGALELGVNHRGARLDHPVNALTSHVQVTGQTGTGKTSLVARVLEQLPAHIGVMVLEPSKQDYARLLGDSFDVVAVGSPELAESGLVLNPCSFPIEKVPVQTHIDQLIALLSSSFDLVSPLPQLLAESIPEAYRRRGWDLVASRNPRLERDHRHPCFPSITEIIECTLDLVARRGYAGDVASNVRAALQARLGALTIGSKARVFDRDEAGSWERLLTGRCVVNLDLVGSAQEKAFVCGLLLVRLWEERRGEQSAELRHLLVIEEAHHVLGARVRSSGPEGQGEEASLGAHLASEGLAEFRAAGQGVVVVDQSAARLADAVVTNTSLKLAFRTTNGPDQDRIAESMTLDESQRRALIGLRRFEAVAFREGMDHPHLLTCSHTDVRRAASVPLRVAGRTDEARLAFEEPAVAVAAMALLADHAHDPRALTSAIGSTLPGAMVGEDLVARVVDLAVADIGRSRQWPHEDRSVVESGGLDAVRDRLLDGSRPFAACRVACPHGGCLLREASQLAGRSGLAEVAVPLGPTHCAAFRPT